MDLSLAFRVLGIEKTKEEGTIRGAYYALLQKTNPEDDEEGFKRLREAYEVAISYSKEIETEKVIPDNEVDFFMSEIEKYYNDLTLRFDVKSWKELLSNPVCDDVGTYMEVRTRVLDFLCNSFRLSRDVWRLIDKTFNIVGDIENLKENYNVNFLNYIKNRIENYDYYNYELLKYRTEEIDNATPDKYMYELITIQEEINNIENAENIEEGERRKQLFDCISKIDNLSVYGVYHIFEDVERLRLYNYLNDGIQMTSLCDKLLPYVDNSLYLSVHVGEALLKKGEEEQAVTLWNDVLSKDESFYRARYDLTAYHVLKKDYYRASDEIEELFEINRFNEGLSKLNKEIAQGLEEILYDKFIKGEEDDKYKGYELILELAWCYLVNGKTQAVRDLLEEHRTTDDEYLYRYCNIYGRALYDQEDYERAIVIFDKWKKMLFRLQDDGTKKTKRRIGSRVYACSIISDAYFRIDDRNNAIKNINEALEIATDDKEIYRIRAQYAFMCNKWEDYNKVLELCDLILQDQPYDYSIWIMHLEAAFKLNYARYVIEDYHRIIEVLPMYHNAYLYAAQTYIVFKRYDDALRVIKTLEENRALYTGELLVIKAYCLRYVTAKKEERMQIYDIIKTLEDNADDKESQYYLEDKSEITLLKGLLYKDEKDYDNALAYLTKASKQNINNMKTRIALGDYYYDLDNYNEALKYYSICKSDSSCVLEAYYKLGLCYEKKKYSIKAIEMYETILNSNIYYLDTLKRLSTLYFERYENYYDETDFNNALLFITKEIEDDPTPDSYLSRAIFYYKANYATKAIEDLKKVLEYDDNNTEALNYLEKCTRKTQVDEKKKLAPNIKTLRKEALQAWIIKDDLLAQKIRTLALEYIDILGNYKKGITFLKLALLYSTSYFDKFETSRQLARAYFMINKKRKAKNYAHDSAGYFTHYETGNKDNYFAFRAFSPLRLSIWAWIEACKGNLNEAMDMLDRAENTQICTGCKYSKCYELYLYRADIYAALRDKEKAIFYYNEVLKIAPECEEAKEKLKRVRK